MISRESYTKKNTGSYSERIEIDGVVYLKKYDLRYGTNPHQPAAYYVPSGCETPIAAMEILKSGKNGLSQTNLEDISYSLNIVKFFENPACAVMKHVNPSGFAFSGTALEAYIKARECDPRAAFGSTVGFNCKVDKNLAEEIMKTFVECVCAPDFSDEAISIFSDAERFKFNSNIRVIKTGALSLIPKFIGDSNCSHRTFKVLADGSLIVAEPLMTSLRTVNDIRRAEGENNKSGKQISDAFPDQCQLPDLQAAWYVNINVRSNGVVIFKNGETLAIGTGEQDRVGAVEQAIEKYRAKYRGKETIEGAVMSSDGFFPFPDAVEVAAAAGIKAIISPPGSLNDAEVIRRANELGVALTHAPERIFAHH